MSGRLLFGADDYFGLPRQKPCRCHSGSREAAVRNPYSSLELTCLYSRLWLDRVMDFRLIATAAVMDSGLAALRRPGMTIAMFVVVQELSANLGIQT
jgi:hypothetical protein